MTIFRLLMYGTVLMPCAVDPTAICQTTASPAADPTEIRVSGTVVSSARNSLIVRTGSNAHQLFVIDSDTIKPQVIKDGEAVTIIAVPTNERDALLALQILVGAPDTEQHLQVATPTESPGQSSPPQPPAKEGAEVPAAVRRLQNDIEREARRFGVGFRTGVGMDPEVILVGVHARMGPVFNRSITFRPNVEFGFGEVTKLFTVNFDTAYRLPLTPQWSKWGAYVGGGPSLGFTHQNFDRSEVGVDFGDLDFAAGLNLFTGIESRRGFFMETKATLWSHPNPSFRLIIGWTF